jgi:hypothetical protein
LLNFRCPRKSRACELPNTDSPKWIQEVRHISDAEVIASPSVNWSNFLSQIRRDYETPPASGVAHGLQKDAIQNGWGARLYERGRDWSFEFRLIVTPANNYLLTMTDTGTTGLIGTVYDQQSPLPTDIPDNEKLARFESMFDSGGGVGPGLFGRGKLLFNVASSRHLIFYDSLTVRNEYRLNRRHIVGRNYGQFRRVRENDSARAAIREWSNGTLQPLPQPGTRITIVDPLQEVIDAIHDGTFLKAIEETWWEIIKKYNARITITDENGRTSGAQIPQEFSALPMSSENEWQVYYRPNVEIEIGRSTYRIKHLHMLLPPASSILREELRGVSVHRRGMKVGTLHLSGIPEEISERFFGYVQLNPDFEELIAQAENTTHYGFASRQNPAYRELRRTVQEHLDLFMQQLGYRNPARDENERAKRILDEAKADLDNILNRMGVPGFGTGRVRQTEIVMSVRDLVFPGESNYLDMGATISGFKYLLRNKSSSPKTVWIEVFTHESEAGVIETLLPRSRVTVERWHTTGALSLHLAADRYPSGKKVSCTARVTDEAQNKLCEKTFYIYIDLTPQPTEELASITLASADWPRTNSRRVDFDQKIRNLIYDVENLTPQQARMKLKVRTIWAAEREPIDDVLEVQLDLSPFGNEQFGVPEVAVTRQKYSEVGRGKITLRCHAVATEATRMWERSKRLAENNVSFYLNMDPRYGFFEDPEFAEDGPAKPRSVAEPVEGLQRWKIRINITHPAYLAVWREQGIRRDEYIHDYMFEEMARQTVFVLLRRNQTDAIRRLARLTTAEDINEMDPDEVLRLLAYPITDAIVSEYY